MDKRTKEGKAIAERMAKARAAAAKKAAAKKKVNGSGEDSNQNDCESNCN